MPTQEKDFQLVATEAGERFVESARETLDALNAARESGDSDAEDSAQCEIDEWPLTVQVRTGWYNPGQAIGGSMVPEEFEILLGTGGPASRIIGTLNQYAEPDSAVFEYQDWFKPWTAARLSGEQTDTLLEFARNFYFGG